MYLIKGEEKEDCIDLDMQRFSLAAYTCQADNVFYMLQHFDGMFSVLNFTGFINLVKSAMLV